MIIDRPITVVQLIAGFAVEKLGGIERYAIELARNIDRQVVDPILCALWDWGTPEEAIWRCRLEEEGIRTLIAAPKDDTAPYLNYMNVVQGIRSSISTPVDILHSHSEFGDIAAIWLRRTLNTHALTRTVHNEREWAKRPLRRLLLTNFICPLMFDIELGVSQQVVNNLNQRPLSRLLGRRAQVMYNSLDFRRFQNLQVDQAAKRAELGIAPDALVIGSVGRLAKQKGYDILLHSIPTVLAHRPDVFFLIAGEGEMQNQLQAEAVRLGVDQVVRFLGRRTDVEELLGIFDLFVSSSRWEGLPTVLLESIAAGVPVVATKVSGTVELIQNGVNGVLVPPEDPQTLAEATLHVLSELDQYRQGASQIQNEIEARFSMKTIAEKHKELYRNLLNSSFR